MTPIILKVQELETVPGFTKHDRLVQGILNAIDEKVIAIGTTLPSINQMVEELGYARKTVVKAYSELKDRGIIESRNRKGYYLINDSTTQKMKVMLLMYGFNLFQERFYKQFKSSIGANVQVDTFFHHNDINVFNSFLSNNIGKYSFYVVAPIHHKEATKTLKLIPPNKLLLVDRYEKIDEEYSHITQQFENMIFNGLVKLLDKIRPFKQFTLFYKKNNNHHSPIGIHNGFLKFCSEYHINGKVETFYENGIVKKGMAYFAIIDSDLLPLLKDCTTKKLSIGNEVGILSFDDTPVKEIICGGITTISVDFGLMAKKAAQFVLHPKKIQETMPGMLFERMSL